MTSKMRYAALLAALILALGLIAMPRAGAASGNDDLEFLQPPGPQFGDPDMPDGIARFYVFGIRAWVGIEAGRLFVFACPARYQSRSVVSTARVTRPSVVSTKTK